ncbi:PTS lactose/cellobiose transporter subunit IIA [Thermophilibacter mediterraneus]|uniref:PTS lactose/cellobiose transporter subunit IIA n=1 Tax=Thermophilibacter mediterraneus TaxID=1871031 RepID=UPI0023569BB2|nr:PTS lactose/cellobiose transporter subunit IIA [Thermophilibacter mediterraneus]
MDEEMEMICFQIISCVGTAKSCYVNSIAKAQEGDFEAAEDLIKQGDEAYAGGHDVHMQLLTSEANGERKGTPLLLLHAEDQMASAETCKLMAQNFINTYRELIELKAKLNA